jgi:hypothetical protein
MRSSNIAVEELLSCCEASKVAGRIAAAGMAWRRVRLFTAGILTAAKSGVEMLKINFQSLEKPALFSSFILGSLSWFEVPPSPLGSIEIIELGEICKVIYGGQQLRGKILSPKDLAPVGIVFVARFRLGYDLLSAEQMQ